MYKLFLPKILYFFERLFQFAWKSLHHFTISFHDNHSTYHIHYLLAIQKSKHLLNQVDLYLLFYFLHQEHLLIYNVIFRLKLLSQIYHPIKSSYWHRYKYVYNNRLTKIYLHWNLDIQLYLHFILYNPQKIRKNWKLFELHCLHHLSYK